MAQPVLGLVASLITMIVALAFISLFDFGSFAGWVSFFTLCLIPMQIVVVVTWSATPAFVARLGQPAKGLVLLLATAIAAAVIAPLALAAAGEGVSPPGPIPSHFVIIVVPTTFFLAIAWGGWPFTAAVKNPVVAGLVLLVASYAITYAVFRVFFNYDFMQGAPVHLASAPRGLFNGVSALVFYVTALAGMFLFLCFDLWPFTTAPAVMKQPVLGIVWTLASFVVGGIAMWIGVTAMGTDPMVFLTRVTAPFIFGTIIVLNMLQNSLFAKMVQPLKGAMNAVAAAVVGVVLGRVYESLAPTVTGTLASGPPGYELEVWLANALLSVTFPFLIFYAVYFHYWPLAKQPSEARREAART